MLLFCLSIKGKILFTFVGKKEFLWTNLVKVGPTDFSSSFSTNNDDQENDMSPKYIVLSIIF